MHTEHNSIGSENAPRVDEASGLRRRVSRRQALGRMSAVATAGAAAWVVPEILTAKPAAGASLSGLLNGGGGSGGGGGGGGTGGNGGGGGVSTSPSTTTGTATPASTTGGGAAHTLPASGVLANTGVDISRDAEIGAAMVAGGWALQRWASRAPRHALAESGQPDETGPPEPS